MLPFYGTDFVYEDLALVFPMEREGGAATHVTRDGQQWVRLESPAYLDYGRVVAWLDPETALPREIEFFDREGPPVRVQHWEEVVAFGEGHFPKRVTNENLFTGTRSTLTFSNIEAGTGESQDRRHR